MTGRSKAGAVTAAAPAAGSRSVVGTIAEAAAIARAAADGEPGHAQTQNKGLHRRARHLERHAASAASGDAQPSRESEMPDARRNRAPAVDVGDDSNGTVTHALLAERAYAYGRSIVEAKGEPYKPGETLAIES